MTLNPVAAVVVASGLCVCVQAGISQSMVASPGGFFQAGADPTTPGSGIWPGGDLSSLISGADSVLNEGMFAGLGTATKSASTSSANHNNSASGSAGMGYVVFDVFNNAPNSSAFSRGGTNGGWKETFTITHPAHNGQAGHLVFTVDASGFLEATGFAGSAAIQVTAYKDNVQLMANPLFSAGDSDPIGTDRQYGNWSIATYGNPNTDSKSVHGTVTFAVPFTFGTPFTLGVYAWGHAGMRSSSGVGGNSTGRVEDGKVRWGGIVNVLAGSTSVTAGSMVSGATGKDWGPGTQPPDPCPGDFNIDGVVDDADFVIFAASYNILDCADPAMADGCPGDMNGDGIVDDADFSLFVFAYDNFVCV